MNDTYGSQAEMIALKGTQDYSTTTPARIRSDSSLPRVLTDTGMVSPPSTQSCALIRDFEDINLSSSPPSSQTNDMYGSQAEMMTLESTQDYSTTTPARIRSDSSLPRVQTDTGMGAPSSTLSRIFTYSFEAHLPNTPLKSFDSIYITISPSLPYLINLSLPHSSSSSQSSDDSLRFIQHGPSAIPPACVDSHAVSPADTGTHNPHLSSFVR